MASGFGLTVMVLGLLLAGTLVAVATGFGASPEILEVGLVLGVILIVIGAVTRSFILWFGLAVLVFAGGWLLATWLSRL